MRQETTGEFVASLALENMKDSSQLSTALYSALVTLMGKEFDWYEAELDWKEAELRSEQSTSIVSSEG